MKRRFGTIFEMGINLKQQGQDSYLGKAHATSDSLKQSQDEAKEIVDMVKALRWQDLGIAPHSGSYYIVLPRPILDKIAQFRQNFPDSATHFGRWFGLDGNSGVYMNVDSGTNRSHFPNGGIPESLRGTGLGYKCYRRLLEFKTWLTSNTGGTAIKNHAWASLIKQRPDPDDVHAIVGPANVMAMIKTLPNEVKIDLAKNFIDSKFNNAENLTATNFAIDDELKAILPPAILAQLDPTRRAEAKRVRDEENAAETRRRTEAEQAQLQDLYPRFGIGEIRRDFRPGDIVIRYSILNNQTVKPRIVTRIGDELKAISIRNYIELSQNINYRPTEVRDLNETWTKINIDSIPDLNDVRLDDTEQAYLNILRQNGQTSAPAPHTEQARDLAIRTLRRNINQAQSFPTGPQITVYDGSGYYDLIHNRFIRPETATKLKQENFIKELYMTVDQYSRYRQNKSSEVFAGFSGTSTHMVLSHGNPQKAINTLTGFIVDYPNNKPFAAKFSMIPLRNKRDVRPGDMVYIAMHPEYYGLTGRVSFSAANAENREFVYVEIFNPELPGVKGRKVAISPQFLRKLRLTA